MDRLMKTDEGYYSLISSPRTQSLSHALLKCLDEFKEITPTMQGEIAITLINMLTTISIVSKYSPEQCKEYQRLVEKWLKISFDEASDFLKVDE